jgi:hypothetical protein
MLLNLSSTADVHVYGFHGKEPNVGKPTEKRPDASCGTRCKRKTAPKSSDCLGAPRG